MTLCLGPFARLAFAEGNPERAAQLAGAAEGLRKRASVRAWPMLRRPEAKLVVEIREALGTDRFEEVSTAGSRLKQQEAVAAVLDRRHASTQAS